MKLLKGQRGVCAGGHPLTVDAGRRAFEAGGNAIDAIVAAQLMATVAEPLLTGLGGGGIALLKQNNRCRVLDFFSDRPGLGPQRPFAPLEHVDVSFGVDTQRFSYGPASVAIPGMIHGLWALHKQGGVLSLPMMARWAADVADQGLEVSLGLSKSIKALTPILKHDPYLVSRFMQKEADGELTAVNQGHYYTLPELSETLMRWANGGPKELLSGATLDAILDTLGQFAPLSRHDFDAYETRWCDPLSQEIKTHGGQARLFTPPLPSQGGVQILTLVNEIATRLIQRDRGKKLEPFGPEAIKVIAEVMIEMENKKGDQWPKPLVSDQHTSFWRSQLGFTTHISTCDVQGNAVGITSSLGETAGLSVDSLGLLLNNFMGEEDVAPPRCMPKVGERLFTMCSPTLLELIHPQGHQDYILGSGGSSRIRSVITHGILYLTQDLLGLGGALKEVVNAPRIHYEAGKLRLETFERPTDTVEQIREFCDQNQAELVCFDDLNLFFGGLHLASGGALGVGGAGDPRRSGSVAIV